MKRIFFSLILLSGSLNAQVDKNLEGLNRHSLELSNALYKPGKNLFCSPGHGVRRFAGRNPSRNGAGDAL